MNNEIFQVASAAVIIVLITVTLRDIKKEYAVILSVIGAVTLLAWGIGRIEPVAQKISELAELSGIEHEYSEILLKALGISITTRMAHDVCFDAGESAIASKVDFCGKIALMLISLPLFERLLSIAVKIVSV